MNTGTRRIVVAAVVAAAGLPAPAQGLVLRDGINMQQHMVGYDRARERLVEVGRQGETHEFDGSIWLRRPGIGPRLVGSTCYRTGPELLLAFGYGADGVSATWEYDGASWQRRAHTFPPTPRWSFAMAHDILRDQVVLFSGGAATGIQVYGETWEWNGSVWAQRATTGPPPRLHHAMAYDLARGECVLFGGQSSGTYFHGDTWVWNGVVWQQRTPANPPPGRFDAAMTYDPGRARAVLYGGFGQAGLLGDLWEWDGLTWQQAAFLAGPGPRSYHDMAFDSQAGESLLISGATSTGWSRDVWKWNGVRWLPVTSNPDRPALGNGVVACPEPIGGGVLEFGSMFGADTWRFSAGTWTRLPSTIAPPARVNSVMWSDGSNAWLFGGMDGMQGTAYADTWRWAATGWQAMATAGSPSARTLARVAFDAARNRAVLFGGNAAYPLGDTWTFDGTTWQQMVLGVAPPPRAGHAMGYDPVRARVILFGGDGGGAGFRNDTWEWDGVSWWNSNPAARPPALGAGVLEFDAGRMLLATAPAPASGQAGLVELWSYDGATWTPVPSFEPRILDARHWFVREPANGSLLLVDGSSVLEFVAQPPLAVSAGAACGLLAPGLAGRANPTPGNAEFGLDVVRAPTAAFVVLAGSITTASVPVGNCTLLLGPPMVVVVLPTNGGGFASHRVPLPAQPALLGATCWFQAGALQPAAPGGFVLSAALRVTVGS